MKLQKNYSKQDVLNNAQIGFEFEFYSSIDIYDVAKSLEKDLGIQIVVPLDTPPVGLLSKPIYHSDIEPTNHLFKLEADFSGGKDMKELITGPQLYKDALKTLDIVLKWIEKWGYTDEKCSIHVNISFHKKFQLLNNISKLNTLKFIINFNEKFVYERFPSRLNSVYARSIKHILPNKIFFYKNMPIDNSTDNIFVTPNEKYYGVNFTKTNKNYLEFRYMGGKDYQLKQNSIIECIDYFIMSIYRSINFNENSWKESHTFKKYMEIQNNLVAIFNNYELFSYKFPDFHITIDMKKDLQIIKAYWEEIKNDIFNLIIRNGIKKANFNYDSDFGINQLYDTKMNNSFLENYDLVHCEIEGILNNCNLYYCKIHHSRLRNCDAKKQNEFYDSKLENVYLPVGNETQNCFIKNDSKRIINCVVKGGVLRSGEVGQSAEIADDVLVVDEEPEVFYTNDHTHINKFKKINTIRYDTLRTYNGN